MGFRESLGEALGNLACSAAQGYRTLTQNSPTAAALLGGAIPEIGSYLLERLYCNKDPYTQPFTPGRCPWRYSVIVTYKIEGDPITSRNGTFTVRTSAWGPIAGASIERQVDGVGPRQDLFNVRLGNYGPDNMSRGSFRVSTIAGPGGVSALATVVVLNTESTPFAADTSIPCTITDPPPPYNPDDFTYRVPVTYTPPGGVSITIPLIGVVGLIYVDANLNLNMPVTFRINPTANINLNFNFEFKASLNLTTGDTTIEWVPESGPGQPPPALPPTSRPPITSPTNPAPPKPPSIPDVQPDPDDAKEGRRLVGAIVTSTINSAKPQSTLIIQNANPNIYAPTLGYVSFAIRSADGSVGWTNDQPVKSLRAYLPCPAPEGAIRVLGTPRSDVSWVITPVYTKALVLAGG